MSAPRPCEHCLTPVTVEAGFEAPLPADSNQWVLHTDARCRDVLRAQLAERTRERDEAIRLGLEVCDDYPAETSASETFIEAARTALGRLRHG